CAGRGYGVGRPRTVGCAAPCPPSASLLMASLAQACARDGAAGATGLAIFRLEIFRSHLSRIVAPGLVPGVGTVSAAREPSDARRHVHRRRTFSGARLPRPAPGTEPRALQDRLFFDSKFFAHI